MRVCAARRAPAERAAETELLDFAELRLGVLFFEELFFAPPREDDEPREDEEPREDDEPPRDDPPRADDEELRPFEDFDEEEDFLPDDFFDDPPRLADDALRPLFDDLLPFDDPDDFLPEEDFLEDDFLDAAIGFSFFKRVESGRELRVRGNRVARNAM